MPTNDFMNFFVYVNGEQLKEYVDEKTGDVFVEADLHTNSSYIIKEETQSYPVTPFYVSGWFINTMGCPCYLRLSVDGQQVWMKPFPPNYTNRPKFFTVQGYKNSSAVRELVFSLPKMSENVRKNQRNGASEVGTIQMECIEGRWNGSHYVWGKVFQDAPAPVVSSESKFQQAYKQNTGTGVTSREGRLLANVVQSDQLRLMHKYVVGSQHFGTLAVHYRTKIFLIEKGLIPAAKSEQNKGGQLCDGNNNSNGVLHEVGSECHGNTEAVNGNHLEQGRESTGNDVTSVTVKREQIKEAMTHPPNGTECPHGGDTLNIGQMSISDDKHSSPRCGSKMGVYSPTGPLGATTGSKVNSKLYCFSPSSKVFMHSPSGPFSSKLGLHSPSQEGKQGQNPTLCSDRDVKITRIGDLNTWKTVEEESKIDKQYRLVEIDDDLQLLEEIDDDVVWMGDDSCCFMDVDPPEIPLVDLCD